MAGISHHVTTLRFPNVRTDIRTRRTIALVAKQQNLLHSYFAYDILDNFVPKKALTCPPPPTPTPPQPTNLSFRDSLAHTWRMN